MDAVLEPAIVRDERKANILLVDDRPENLVALEAILDPLGESLWKAYSGKEALRHLLLEDFALILLDAEMPGMNGFETAELIRQRERTRHVPIIFVTAHRESQHMFRSYSVGAVDYMTKPFDPEILRSKVRIFVDLFKKNEQIKRQAELLHQSELREAERRQQEMQESLEREHMRRLTEELEARVEERTKELVQANEEMEAFCYSVSHDLRAPLRAIMSTSMILIEDSGEKLNENDKEQLLRQSAAAKRMGKLIDDLLQLSRLGRKAMERQWIDLSDIAQAVADDMGSRDWPKPISFKVQAGLQAYADPGLAHILLVNLLENACKYSPNGGTIEVGQGERDAFFVRDEGIGFEMKYAHKLFLPFERLVAEGDYEGTGIGLANVQRIVQRHGGKIWAESELGKGATFYFTLG
jgi:hypothetical protein